VAVDSSLSSVKPWQSIASGIAAWASMRAN